MLYSIFEMECSVLLFLFVKQLFREHLLRHDLIFKNGINNIFSTQTSFLLVSNDMHARRNRKTVESWGFDNLGFECNEFGEVIVVFCKTCREYLLM